MEQHAIVKDLPREKSAVQEQQKLLRQLREGRLPLLVETRHAAIILFGEANRKNLYRLYKLIKSGAIKSKKLGANYWILKSELERLAADETHEPKH
jgi:hypothetical protein|tara:strand:- start:903 stop:1190 length:288 start_codon:yes stop_codon:yes gene_type:complete